MTTHALKVKKKTRNFDSAYELDFDDLVCKRRAGHMGHHEYRDSSIKLWDEFIARNAHNYYIPRNEILLIQRASKLTAALIGQKPVTIISRGCGTKFSAKEGALLKELHNIKGVVYLDRCNTALEQSASEGKSLLPDAWHKIIQCDLYDPSLRYDVEGLEVNVMFGLTSMNIEGFPEGNTPYKVYCENLYAMHAQMQKGAHFITTFDHNEDSSSIENAYAEQKDFAKHMLADTVSIDPNAVDFLVKFHKNSKILAHGFRFKIDTTVEARSGLHTFKFNDILWFNNSVKPSANDMRKAHTEAGFNYIRQDILMDPDMRIGWHHFIKE